MTKLFCIERRNAHKTMHTGFVLEHSVRILAVNFEGNVAVTAVVIFVLMKKLHFKILLFKKFKIHVEEHARKILSVIPARSREYGHHRVPSIVFAYPCKLFF